MNAHALDILGYHEILSRIAARALSPGGRDRARAWLPMERLDAIRTRQDAITELRHATAGGAFPFDRVGDVVPPLERARRDGQLATSEVFDILSAARVAAEVRDSLARQSGDAPTLAGLLPRLPYALDEVIAALAAAVSERDRLRDDASPELARLRRGRDRALQQIRGRLDAILQSPQMRRYVQEPVPFVRDGRHVIAVPAQHQEKIAGTVRGMSASGASVFIEPEAIAALENECRLIEDAEVAETDRVLWKLSARIAENADLLDAAFDALADLDALQAAASIARDWHLAMPEIVESGPLVLDAVRNPVLVALARDEDTNPAEAVVPTSLRLGEAFDCLVITGPNTGGKTVALKTAGLCVLLALAGLPIPSGAGSSIPIYRALYADIGDEQSLQQNLSTFSAHLRRIVAAIADAGDRTLVLLDELGAGTDPAEGAALGEAILRELLNRNAHAIVTTHLGHLKRFGHANPRAENGSVGFDPDTLAPTYELSIGTPGSSHALHIARRMGMPETVLNDAAEELSRGEEKALTDLIAEIQKTKAELTAERSRVADEGRRVRNLQAEAERRLAEAERAAQRDEGPLVKLMRDIADDLGRLAAPGHASRATLRDELISLRARITRELPVVSSAADTSRRSAKKTDRGERAPFVAKPGDTVFVRSLGRSMEVLSVDDRRGKAVVTKGMIRTEVSLDDLQAGPLG